MKGVEIQILKVLTLGKYFYNPLLGPLLSPLTTSLHTAEELALSLSPSLANGGPLKRGHFRMFY